MISCLFCQKKYKTISPYSYMTQDTYFYCPACKVEYLVNNNDIQTYSFIIGYYQIINQIENGNLVTIKSLVDKTSPKIDIENVKISPFDPDLNYKIQTIINFQ